MKSKKEVSKISHQKAKKTVKKLTNKKILSKPPQGGNVKIREKIFMLNTGIKEVSRTFLLPNYQRLKYISNITNVIKINDTITKQNINEINEKLDFTIVKFLEKVNQLKYELKAFEKDIKNSQNKNKKYIIHYLVMFYNSVRVFYEKKYMDVFIEFITKNFIDTQKIKDKNVLKYLYKIILPIKKNKYNPDLKLFINNIEKTYMKIQKYTQSNNVIFEKFNNFLKYILLQIKPSTLRITQ